MPSRLGQRSAMPSSHRTEEWASIRVGRRAVSRGRIFGGRGRIQTRLPRTGERSAQQRNQMAEGTARQPIRSRCAESKSDEDMITHGNSTIATQVVNPNGPVVWSVIRRITCLPTLPSSTHAKPFSTRRRGNESATVFGDRDVTNPAVSMAALAIGCGASDLTTAHRPVRWRRAGVAETDTAAEVTLIRSRSTRTPAANSCPYHRGGPTIAGRAARPGKRFHRRQAT